MSDAHEKFSAIREGHRNAAEDAWFKAVPDLDARKAFCRGFDAGYSHCDATLSHPATQAGALQAVEPTRFDSSSILSDRALVRLWDSMPSEDVGQWERALAFVHLVREADAQLAATQPSAAAGETGLRKGYVAVPMRLTRAMQEVLENESWEWADLLMMAEATTEEEDAAIRRFESLDQLDKAEREAAEHAAPGDAPADPMNYKGMFLDAVRALAEIDALLGLPEDGCNDPQVTVSALRDALAGFKDMQESRDQWVDAQYQAAAPGDGQGAEEVSNLKRFIASAMSYPSTERSRTWIREVYDRIDALAAPSAATAAREQETELLQFAPKLPGVSSAEPTLERIIWRYYLGAMDDEQDAQHFAKLYADALKKRLAAHEEVPAALGEDLDEQIHELAVDHNLVAGDDWSPKAIDFARAVIALASRPEAPAAPSAEGSSLPEGWNLVEKKTCYVLQEGDVVVATLAGPDAEENAARIAAVLSAPIASEPQPIAGGISSKEEANG